MRQPSLPYNLLKFSLQIYGRKPGELEPDEYDVAQSQAKEECALQSKILVSEQGMKAAVPKQAVDSALAAMAQRYESHQSFEDDLISSGLDKESMAEALEVELLVEAAIAQIAAQAELPSDKEVTEAFAACHGHGFERRLARHILITINDQFPENSRLAAMVRISKVRRLAVEAGTDFDALAARFSECPSSIQGGTIGLVERGKLYASLDESLFSMEVGEVSEVLESPMGFHLILCEKIVTEAEDTFDKVKEKFREKMLAQAQKKEIRAWLASLQDADSC